MKATLTPTTQIEYDDVGQGPAVVLLHAFPLARAMWQPQVTDLLRDFRVIVPDVRGFGGSSPFADAPSVDQAAADVAGLLDHLKLTETVVVGGLSMGGYIALAFARQFPQRLRGLVLADTRAEPDNDEGKSNRDKLIAFTRNHSAADVIDQTMAKMVSAETRMKRPDVVAEVRRIAAAQSVDGVIAALQMLRDRPDARPGLTSIAVPTLVMVGSDDAITPRAAAEVLVAGIAGARLVEVPGAGHLANLEQPQAFNAALRSFLQTL